MKVFSTYAPTFAVFIPFLKTEFLTGEMILTDISHFKLSFLDVELVS